MQEPGEKPITIEIAHGDPKAVEKADAALAAMEFCKAENIPCPWMEKGRCTRTRCPAADDERI